MRVPTAPVVAGSLIGGYLVARQTKIRPLGGAVLAAGAAVAVPQWWKTGGPVVTGILLGTYLGGFGVSHPLAKKIGAWPSVLTVAGVSGVASLLLSDLRTARTA